MGPGEIAFTAILSDYNSAVNTIVHDTAIASYGSLTSALTLTNSGGVEVIDFSDINLNNANLTLSGGSSAYYVIRVAGGLSLTALRR